MTSRWLKQHWGFKSQVALFDYIWDTRKWVCPYTGKDLKGFADDRLMRRICCAHVLPKGKYPLFKLNSENVELVHPHFHQIVDNGTFDDRDKHLTWDFDAWDKKVEEMKVKYEMFKDKYLL